MKAHLTLVHATNVELMVKTEPTIFAPKDMLFIVPEGSSFLIMARTLYEVEKERSEWIRKYDNVLGGLSYWRERALSHE